MRQAGIKLIGPVDVAPDSKLQEMGDAAIGTMVMSSYSSDLPNEANQRFVSEWHKQYGKDSYPDFMSVGAGDAMSAVFSSIKKRDGKIAGMALVDDLKTWSTTNSPRGSVKIDPATRDVILDEYALEVIRKPDGALGHKVIGTIPQVKDQCKELKIGRCADNP
jgi:branched-chain amino acid transport system substrate-binding protein